MQNINLDSLSQWHNDGEYEKIIELIKSLPEEELNYDLISQLARAYNNVENYKEAISLLTTIKEEGNKDALWHFRMGYAYYYLDNLEEAKESFELSQKINPHDEDCILFLDYIHQELTLNPLINDNEFEKIIQFIEELPQDKRNYMLTMELAKAYNSTSRYKDTVEKLLQVKNEGEDDPTWSNLIGYAYYNLDELEKALEAIEVVHETYPENEAVVHLLKSIQNELMIKPLWAKNEYYKIIDYILNLPEDEKNYLLLSGLGRAYSKTGEFHKVIEQLLIIEEEGQGDPHWHYRIGHAYYYVDELEKAQSQFEEVLKIITEDSAIETFLLWIKHELHIKKLIHDEKFSEVIDYIESTPSDEKSYSMKLNLAFSYIDTNEYDKSINTLLNIEEESQSNDAWHAAIGHSYFYNNQLDEASNACKASLEINPHNSEALRILEMLENSTNNIAH